MTEIVSPESLALKKIHHPLELVQEQLEISGTLFSHIGELRFVEKNQREGSDLLRRGRDSVAEAAKQARQYAKKAGLRLIDENGKDVTEG